jgi:hypothetical protein
MAWKIIAAACLLAVLACSRTMRDGGTLKVMQARETTIERDGSTRTVDGTDRESIRLLIAGVVSIAVPSPLPLVATILARPLGEIGSGLARTIAIPAQAVDNLTTHTVAK